MIEIKNLLFQPVTLQRSGQATALHLGPRGRARIPQPEISEEMLRAEARGIISFKADPPEPAASSEPAEDTSTAKRRKDK